MGVDHDLKRHYAAPGMWFRRARPVIRAVDGVSFSLKSGETFSVVGESGCGKTTLSRMILDLEKSTSGEVAYQQKDLAKLRGADYREYRTSVQAVFQDPTTSLDPRRRIRSIVAEPLIVNTQLRGAALQDRVDALMRSTGLDPAVGKFFPHELSGGMRQRVAVAQALALNPKIILLDEPVSSLDVSIRAQIMNLLKDLQQEFGVAYILIAHDLGTVRYLSHQIAAMYVGQFVEQGASEKIFTEALHPYTISLISAVGSTDRLRTGRIVLKGEPASPAAPPPGCRFHSRCWLREQLGSPERCTSTQPELRPVTAPDHLVACHFSEELADPSRRADRIGIAVAGSGLAPDGAHERGTPVTATPAVPLS